jgi:hypothetical protein
MRSCSSCWLMKSKPKASHSLMVRAPHKLAFNRCPSPRGRGIPQARGRGTSDRAPPLWGENRWSFTIRWILPWFPARWEWNLEHKTVSMDLTNWMKEIRATKSKHISHAIESPANALFSTERELRFISRSPSHCLLWSVVEIQSVHSFFQSCYGPPRSPSSDVQGAKKIPTLRSISTSTQ